MSLANSHSCEEIEESWLKFWATLSSRDFDGVHHIIDGAF